MTEYRIEYNASACYANFNFRILAIDEFGGRRVEGFAALERVRVKWIPAHPSDTL